MKLFFKLLAILALYTGALYACKKTTNQGPKPTGLEGTWGGRRSGGAIDTFSLNLKLGDSLDGTFNIGTTNIKVTGVWGVVDTLFFANCIEVVNGNIRTLSARVNTDSLNGRWFSQGGGSGNFKIKKIK